MACRAADLAGGTSKLTLNSSPAVANLGRFGARPWGIVTRRFVWRTKNFAKKTVAGARRNIFFLGGPANRKFLREDFVGRARLNEQSDACSYPKVRDILND
jgi:hypothetical protein